MTTMPGIMPGIMRGHRERRRRLQNQCSVHLHVITLGSPLRALTLSNPLETAKSQAQKPWPDGKTEESWEALSHAFHPRNLASVRRLAALGLLRRGGVIQIDSDLRVTVSTVTLRQEGMPSVSRTVYCTMPLHGTGRVAGTANVMQVAGGVVYRLGPGETAIVSEDRVQATASNWRGDPVYRELWGSRIFTYSLTITVAPGLAVKGVRCARVAGPEPEVTVRNGQNGTVIEVTATRPWLATVSVIVSSDER